MAPRNDSQSAARFSATLNLSVQSCGGEFQRRPIRGLNKACDREPNPNRFPIAMPNQVEIPNLARLPPLQSRAYPRDDETEACAPHHETTETGLDGRILSRPRGR